MTLDGAIDTHFAPLRDVHYVEVPFASFERQVQGLRLYRVVDGLRTLIQERFDPARPKLDATTSAIVHIAAEHGIDITSLIRGDIEEWPSDPCTTSAEGK